MDTQKIQTPKRTNGARNRNVGSSWERTNAEDYRNAGFPHVVTSRSCNRLRDAEKIDLCNNDELRNGRFIYNVQSKCTSSTLKYAKVLSELKKEEGLINVIHHKQTVKQGTRFFTRDKFAILYYDDWMKMVSRLRELEEIARRLTQPHRDY